MTTATDLFRSPTFDALKALSIELGTAIGTRAGWTRLDSDWSVSASRDLGRLVVVGNSAGWWALRHAPGEKSILRGPVDKATTAVKLAFRPEETL